MITRTITFAVSDIRSRALGASMRESVTLRFELEHCGQLLSCQRVVAHDRAAFFAEAVASPDAALHRHCSLQPVDPGGVCAKKIAAKKIASPDGRGSVVQVGYAAIEGSDLQRMLELSLAGWALNLHDKPSERPAAPLSAEERIRAHEALLDRVARVIEQLLPPGSPVKLRLLETRWGEQATFYWPTA